MYIERSLCNSLGMMNDGMNYVSCIALGQQHRAIELLENTPTRTVHERKLLDQLIAQIKNPNDEVFHPKKHEEEE